MHKKVLLRYYVIVVFAFANFSCLTSCSIINYNAVYDANALNIPLHKEKQEIKGSAGYGSILGFNTDVSYAATNNIAVKVAANYNHQYLIKNRLFGGDHFNLKNHYFEAAAGYYKFLENSFINSVSLDAGYGKGVTNKAAEDRFEGRFSKFFLQLNAGHVSDKKEYGLGIRYSGIFYPELYHKFRKEDMVEPQNYYYKNLHLPTIECALMGAVGSRKLKGTLQYGLAVPLKKLRVPIGDTGYTFASLNNWSAIFQVGLRYNFLLTKNEKF